jgi:hypothetical protein
MNLLIPQLTIDRKNRFVKRTGLSISRKYWSKETRLPKQNQAKKETMNCIGKSNLTDGLIAYYSFNGHANDISSNNCHGQVHGATLTTDRFGNSNSAYFFDGIYDFIHCGSILDVSAHDTISISAWIYPQQISKNNNYSGLGFGKKTTGTLQLRVRTDTDTRFQAHHASALEKDSISKKSDRKFDYNKWYHLVAIYSHDNVEMYIDGIAQSFKGGHDRPHLSKIPQNSIFRIGLSFTDKDVPRFFHGKIDEVRVYNRGLTEQEIDSLYKC